MLPRTLDVKIVNTDGTATRATREVESNSPLRFLNVVITHTPLGTS